MTAADEHLSLIRRVVALTGTGPFSPKPPSSSCTLPRMSRPRKSNGKQSVIFLIRGNQQ
jgi:hypothetical protein